MCSLEDHWQEDLLFVLKPEQDGYEFCQQQMAECDRRLEQYLQQQQDRSQGAADRVRSIMEIFSSGGLWVLETLWFVSESQLSS